MKRIGMVLLACVMCVGCAKQSEAATEVTTKLTTTTTTTVTTTTTTATAAVEPAKGEGIVEISSKEAMAKMDAKETFLLVLSKTTCPACQEYKPHLEEYLKEYPYVSVYYVELDTSDSSDSDALIDRVYLEYTPTTFLIISGDVLDAYVGSDDERLVKMINSITW